MNTRRPYFTALGGFAFVVLLFAFFLGASSVARFHPGGEFSTTTQGFLFNLLVLGGLLLVLSGGPFALALTPFLAGRRRLPAPLFVGIVGGVIAVAVAGLGVSARYARLFALPRYANAVIPGLIAALCIVPVAYLLAPRTSSTHSRA
jgi:fucose 4-O-acetylase-like acetyltransferase